MVISTYVCGLAVIFHVASENTLRSQESHWLRALSHMAQIKIELTWKLPSACDLLMPVKKEIIWSCQVFKLQVYPSELSSALSSTVSHTDILFHLITTIHPAFDFNGNLLPLIIFNQADKFNFAQATIYMLFVSFCSVDPQHFPQ